MTAHLTDTHCHLNLMEPEAVLESALANAREAGVERILVPGFDLPSSELAVALAEANPEVYAAVGIHPNHITEWEDSIPLRLRELAKHPKVVAIGEIGLDYYRNPELAEKQQNGLRIQLSLAYDLALPVSIHIRDAWDDCWRILNEWQQSLAGSPLQTRPGVLHSFDGALIQASKAVEAGFKIGISGPVTYKNALDKHELAAELALDAILIETDAPFLTPVPHRGKPNEPSYTKHIVSKVAGLRGNTPDYVAEQTAINASTLFQWD